MKNSREESGFSYIDVMIALLILMVGLLGAVQALTANLLRSYETEKAIIAKQMAFSTIESIFAARDIGQKGAVEGWDSIGNVGANLVKGEYKGIFLKEWRPVRSDLGWDGVAGTRDDACDAPGSCHTTGKPGNASAVIEGFERRVEITDLQDIDRPSPPHAIARRRIDVTVRYQMNQLTRQQTVSTIIANYEDNLDD